MPYADPEKALACKLKWQREHQAEINEKQRARYAESPEIRAKDQAYYEANKARILEKAKANYERNREDKKRKAAEYRATHREEYKSYFKALDAKKDPTRVAGAKRRSRKWQLANAELICKRISDRLKTDADYRIRCLLRGRIRAAVAGKRKIDDTMALVGINLDGLKLHIESLFVRGMNWDAFMRGEIHIDHKRPCASFDLSRPDHQRECFHYTNLQPLWKFENLSKGAKFNLTETEVGPIESNPALDAVVLVSPPK
jgi:hypothetical protein